MEKAIRSHAARIRVRKRGWLVAAIISTCFLPFLLSSLFISLASFLILLLRSPYSVRGLRSRSESSGIEYDSLDNCAEGIRKVRGVSTSMTLSGG
jgi:hypothetical protein